MAATGPDATLIVGPLTTAIASSGPSSGCSSASDSGTLSIAPSGRVSNKRPRNSTSVSASSRLKTPARCAAVYSPMLWPIIAAGSMPHDIHSLACAYWIVSSAGSASEGRSSWRAAAASSPGAGNSSGLISGMPRRARISRHPSTAALNAGSSRYRSAPMVGYCAPPPANMKATLRGVAALSCVNTRFGSLAISAAAASCASRATTTRRCFMAWRPTCSVCPASARLRSGCVARYSASACVPASSAVGVRADSTSSS